MQMKKIETAARMSGNSTLPKSGRKGWDGNVKEGSNSFKGNTVEKISMGKIPNKKG